MEQQPNKSEDLNDYQRPQLDIDLSGPEGNVFIVIMRAREQLEGPALMGFNVDTRMAMQPGLGTRYEDILDIVNGYTDLLDTSGMYPQYGPQAHLQRAVDQLNDRLRSLPPGVESEITGLYPEFDDPELGPDKYAVLLTEEVERVEQELAACGDEERAPLERLHAMLLDCARTLQRAGV